MKYAISFQHTEADSPLLNIPQLIPSSSWKPGEPGEDDASPAVCVHLPPASCQGRQAYKRKKAHVQSWQSYLSNTSNGLSVTNVIAFINMSRESKVSLLVCFLIAVI